MYFLQLEHRYSAPQVCAASTFNDELVFYIGDNYKILERDWVPEHKSLSAPMPMVALASKQP